MWQLVAKAFPGRGSIMQVIKTARSYWRQHPDNYIAIHCAYGEAIGFFVLYQGRCLLYMSPVQLC